MAKLSRFETAVVVTTAAAGLGVAASAALASSLDLEESMFLKHHLFFTISPTTNTAELLTRAPSSSPLRAEKPTAPAPVPMSFEEFELRWPKMPASKVEFLDAWADGYVQSKGVLSSM